MSTDIEMLRSRAMDCRNLAKGARNEVDRDMLDDIAGDLESEARKLEAIRSSNADEASQSAGEERDT